MLAYTIRRLLLAIPVVLIVATSVFLLLKFAPGDPAGVMLGPDASEEQRMDLRRRLGLEDPLPVQYVRWLSAAARGDLGRSLFLDQPVGKALRDRAEPTIMLGLLAFVVAIVIGLPAGMLAAYRRGRWLDLGTMGVSMVGMATPSFVLGLLLMFFFAVKLRWLPVSGYRPLAEGIGPTLRSLILPSVTLGVAQAAFLSRMTRSMMLEVLNQDYIRTARAKGLHERAVIMRHALKNALLPVVTVVGLQIGALLSGAVVTETVFAWPGIGRLAVSAIAGRDFPVIQGCLLVIATIFVLVNLCVDLLYAVVDPRIHYQ